MPLQIDHQVKVPGITHTRLNRINFYRHRQQNHWRENSQELHGIWLSARRLTSPRLIRTVRITHYRVKNYLRFR